MAKTTIKAPAKKSSLKNKSEAKENKTSKFIAHSTSLKVKDSAPAFSGLNQNNETVKLSDFKGKKIILFFYPKDNTPACTAEACNLQENFNHLKKDGYEIIGVSADDVKSHKKFADKFKFTFNLLADTEMQIIKAYDVWGTKQFMGRIYDGILRTTFVIDEKHKIKHIITSVDTKNHTEQIRLLSE